MNGFGNAQVEINWEINMVVLFPNEKLLVILMELHFFKWP